MDLEDYAREFCAYFLLSSLVVKTSSNLFIISVEVA